MPPIPISDHDNRWGSLGALRNAESRLDRAIGLMRSSVFDRLRSADPAHPPHRRIVRPPLMQSIDQLDKIPEELEEADPFFKKNVCPISFEPLRNPVADKNHPQHIYEKKNILSWLNTHNTSPITRESMSAEDLIPANNLKNKIDQKLNEYVQKQHEKSLDIHRVQTEQAAQIEQAVQARRWAKLYRE